MLTAQTDKRSRPAGSSEPANDEDIPLTQRAYLELRGHIIGGVYAPGSRLSARRIVEQIGLGATPVREALVRLQHEGLLQTIPRIGYVVAELTRRSVVDFYEIWRLVGPAIVRLGVENHDAAQLQQLEAVARQLIALTPQLSDPSQLTVWIRLAETRFAVLAAASRNPHLVAINDRLSLEKERIYSFHMRRGANRAGFRFFSIDPERVRHSIQLARERRGAEAEMATRAAIDETHNSMLTLFWRASDAAETA